MIINQGVDGSSFNKSEYKYEEGEDIFVIVVVELSLLLKLLLLLLFTWFEDEKLISLNLLIDWTLGVDGIDSTLLSLNRERER